MTDRCGLTRLAIRFVGTFMLVGLTGTIVLTAFGMSAAAILGLTGTALGFVGGVFVDPYQRPAHPTPPQPDLARDLLEGP